MTYTRNVLAALAVVAVLVAGAPAASAHGGHDHVIGTVKAIDTAAGTVTVEGRDRKTTVVTFNAATKFLRGTAAASAADLAVGMRVVIDADTVDKKAVAKEVKLGVTAKPAPAPAASPSL
jgi:hypothetical protein